LSDDAVAGGGGSPLGRLLSVTISVTDLPKVVDAYRTHLGYRLLETGYVPPALAQSWAAPLNADARYGLMTPPNNTAVSLRFVEGSIPENYKPLRTFGWAAVEIVVTDVDALDAALADSPFEVINPPADLAFGAGALRAMTVRGPSQEILIFTQIKRPVPGYDLPVAADIVDRPFITVLAAEEIEKARNFYRDKFLIAPGPQIDTPIRGVNDAFDLAPDELQRMTTIAIAQQSYIEIDQYPDMAAKRFGDGGYLVPGVALVTFEGNGLDALPLYWLGAPSPYEMAPYASRRKVTFYGAAGELIELVEAS
jgi:catechol 2,3-dioxygenase-like lactoylglutathione lyase family enzyme